MTEQILDARQIGRLVDLADILMPAAHGLPAPSTIGTFGALLQSAVTACGIAVDDVRTALAALPNHLDWESVRSFQGSRPADFDTLALVASGAYVMAPEVLGRLGFPIDRRNPAGTLDAADEYETGILEPVLGRGPVYRDPRRVGKD